MLFHSLSAPDSGVYIQQIICALREPIDNQALERAWQRVVNRHPLLRTSFHLEGSDQPYQQVHRHAPLAFLADDWSDLPEADGERRLDEYLREDRKRGFKLDEAPLMRLAVFKCAQSDHRFI